MEAQTRIKVAVSHRLPLVQAGLEAMLAGQFDVELLRGWNAELGVSGLDRSAQAAVLDTASGLRLAEEFQSSAFPGRCHMMILADNAGEWDLRQAIAKGVLGFHLLNSPVERVLAGVRQVARGSRSIDPAVATLMADCLTQPNLTGRERDVLSLIVDGSCNKEVANALGIAVGTVKGHVRVLLEKLGVSSRTQAVIVARQRGLVGQAESVWPLMSRQGAAPAPSGALFQ